MKIRTILVEDIAAERNTFKETLENCCPELMVVGEGESIETGFEVIMKTKPDLVFLDINLNYGTGFDLLNKCLEVGDIHFEIIFLTGETNINYPVRAIHYSALDFIYKPIDSTKLHEAVNRVKAKLASKATNPFYQQQLELLIQNLKNNQDKKTNKVAFHRSGGAIEFVQTSHILYCEAEKDITHIHLSDNTKFTAMKNLSFYARPLEIDFNFFRISDKLLINLEYLQNYDHNDDFKVLLTNGKILYASRRGGQDLKQYLKEKYH